MESVDEVLPRMPRICFTLRAIMSPSQLPCRLGTPLGPRTVLPHPTYLSAVCGALCGLRLLCIAGSQGIKGYIRQELHIKDLRSSRKELKLWELPEVIPLLHEGINCKSD